MSLNFALILFILLIVTGIIWAIDRWSLQPTRRARAQAAGEQFDVASAPSIRQSSGDAEAARLRQETVSHAARAPWWVEYSASFFPVILFVFVLRSFVVEPFRIPSGSMIPTLEVGDLILVNKFTYGIRLPIVNTKVVELGQPKRGDVVVFRYPLDQNVDYIKRVIGVPGDEVAYLNKRLTINGEAVETTKAEDYFDAERISYVQRFNETVGGVKHQILNAPNSGTSISPIAPFRDMDACTYSREGVRCKVPAGHYYMMGDNRDNSLDSRYWGFVPEANIVGKAFFVWMNFSDLKRIGRFQ